MSDYLRRNIKLLLFLFVVISFNGKFYGQTFNFVNFTNNDGLPSLNINFITQDSLGFIFIGTQNGLSIFNGRNFMNFTKKNGLPDNYIVSIFQIKWGKILISTLDGTVLFDGENFKKIKLGKSYPQNIVESLLNDGDSTFVGTAKGVFVLKQDKASPSKLFEKLNNRRIYTIVKHNGKYFIGTDEGYAIVKENKTKIYLKDHIVKNIYFQTEAPGNELMWLTTNKGILKVIGRKIIRYTKLGGISLPGNFYSAFYDNENTLWIGTHSGLIELRNNRAKSFTIFNGLPSNTINYLFKDNSNSLWIATDHGLCRLSNENILLYDRMHNVSSPVWNILEIGKSDYLIGTDGTGLLRLKNNKVTRFKIPGINLNSVWGMFKDSRNNIWLDTDAGLLVKSGDSVKIFKNNKKFLTDYIFAITEDKNNIIWLGSYSNGLYYYFNGKFVNLTTKDGLLSNSISTLAVNNNTLWVGTNKGINLIKNFKIIPLKYNKELGNIDVMDFSFAPDGNPFIATLDYGIYYIDLKSDKIINISTKDGLSDNSVMFLTFDKELNLWIGTNKGLNRFDYLEFKSTGKKIIRAYSPYDGFLSAETNQGSHLIDSQGNLLYGSTSGLVKFNLSKRNKTIDKPKLFVYQVDVNFKPFLKLNPYVHSGKKVINLNYEQNYITFHYSFLDLENPYMIKFRYMLKGFDDKFSPITTNNSVTYNKLPPGNYQFIVEAINNANVRATARTNLVINIAAPFWKTRWFYILVVLTFILIFYSVSVIRIRNLKKHAKELQKLYDEKVFYQKKLEESEKTYRELFEKSSDANLIINPKTLEIIEANRSAVNLYGYSLEQLRKMSLMDLAVDSEKLKENISKVIKNKVELGLETIHRKKDGGEIQLSINASVVNFDGQEAILAIYKDITKQKEIEQTLREAKDAAEKSNRLKSEFLAQVSHEIRTPINNILNYTNLIKEEIGNGSNKLLEMAFGAIDRSSKRIIRTIDLIINMSELQRGTYEPQYKMVDLLKDVLMPLVEQHKFAAEEKNLNFELNANTKEAKLFIDEYTVIQIFDNLIENAIKYTKKGSVFINLNYDFNKSKCIVEVKDTGIGISREYLPYIFEPFSQEEQGYTRRFDGNGLGLSLVKSYCDLNNAIVEVESEKGKGSTFRVIFSLN